MIIIPIFWYSKDSNDNVACSPRLYRCFGHATRLCSYSNVDPANFHNPRNSKSLGDYSCCPKGIQKGLDSSSCHNATCVPPQHRMVLKYLQKQMRTCFFLFLFQLFENNVSLECSKYTKCMFSVCDCGKQRDRKSANIYTNNIHMQRQCWEIKIILQSI